MARTGRRNLDVRHRWERLGMPYSVHRQAWPAFAPELTREDLVEVVVQVNGKVRDRLTVPADLPEARARELALASERVREHLNGQEPAYVPGRLVNVVSFTASVLKVL